MARVGVVLKTEGDRALVRATRRGVCDGCSDSDGCSASAADEASEVVAALTSRGHGTITEDPPDEITSLVERHVDARLAEAVSELKLDKLLGDARERRQRDARNYVI